MFRGWRLGSLGHDRVARPEQTTTLVIDHVGVGVQEFILERLKVVIVQTELKLEGAIGHAASTLEHGQRLVQNLFEGHGRFSATLALLPADGKVFTGAVSHGKSTTSISGARRSGTASCTTREEAGNVPEKFHGMPPSDILT